MTAALLGLIALLIGAQFIRQEFKNKPAANILKRRIPFQNLFDRFSTVYGVPVRLMEAIVEVESSFNPRAVNLEESADRRRSRNVDSLGLGQILWPDTAQAVRPGTRREELFDPEINLSIAFQLMSSLLRTWPATDTQGFPARAVAAYNAGAPRFNPDGRLRNHVYVDKVKNSWTKLL